MLHTPAVILMRSSRRRLCTGREMGRQRSVACCAVVCSGVAMAWCSVSPGFGLLSPAPGYAAAAARPGSWSEPAAARALAPAPRCAPSDGSAPTPGHGSSPPDSSVRPAGTRSDLGEHERQHWLVGLKAHITIMNPPWKQTFPLVFTIYSTPTRKYVVCILLSITKDLIID